MVIEDSIDFEELPLVIGDDPGAAVMEMIDDLAMLGAGDVFFLTDADAIQGTARAARLRHDRRTVVLDGRERLIEAVQQFLPARIAVRAAEAFCVILNAAPAHQQQIATGPLQARPDLDALETRCCADQRLRFAHRRLEARFVAVLYV